MNIAEEILRKYRIRLIEQEKSTHTIEKYMRDIQSFIAFLADVEPPLSKMQVIAYKESLKTRYATSSVNSMLTPVNDFLRFLGGGTVPCQAGEMSASDIQRSQPRIDKGGIHAPAEHRTEKS